MVARWITRLARGVALVAAPATLAAQGDEGGAFLTRLGRDTVAVERFTRSGTRLEGSLVVRTPRTTLSRYAAELRPDGTIGHFEMAAHTGGSFAGPVAQRITVTFQGDSAVVERVRGDSTQTQRLALQHGTVPIIVNCYALLEQVTRQARGRSGVPGILFVGFRAQPATVTPVGGDTLSVMLGQIGPLRARVDADGRVLGVTGRGSTLQVEVERMGSAEVESLAAGFAAREATGGGLGTLSPRDTVRAVVGGANLLVDYGRPARRGREIFGTVVPWGQVWRTGANAATQFRTDADLEIGGAMVPAGTYTLWSVPTPSGWTLIVNRQTGQWGTEYDPAQDLARVQMTVESLPERVERFTVAIDVASAGSALRLSWDRTLASVPVKKRG